MGPRVSFKFFLLSLLPFLRASLDHFDGLGNGDEVGLVQREVCLHSGKSRRRYCHQSPAAGPVSYGCPSIAPSCSSDKMPASMRGNRAIDDDLTHFALKLGSRFRVLPAAYWWQTIPPVP